MVLTADKGVALVVMDKSQYVDKCMALLDDTKVYNLVKTPPKNCNEMLKKPSNSSTKNMVLQDYIGEANTITTNCSPQVTHLQHLDSMVYLKFIKLIALCDP